MDFIQSTKSTVWEIFDYHISKLEGNGFWILGKSYSQINISQKNETECESLSCYEKSRATKKICKPGINKIKQQNNIDVKI